MGLRFLLNGHVIDSGESPNQEDTDSPAQAADGRTLLKDTRAVYNPDGNVIRSTDRVDIGGSPLPKSGNVTINMGAPRASEVSDHTSDPDIKNVLAARAAYDAANAAQSAQNAAMQAQLTNLQQTSSVPGTSVGTWQVKTKTNS